MSENTDDNKPSSATGAAGFSTLDFPTFAGCKLSRDFLDDAVDVVVSGVPFDLASTERPGARFGPGAIRRASRSLAWELRRWPWDFHAFDILGVTDCGDLCFDPTNGDQMVRQLGRHSTQILSAGKTMLTLGGDHFISLPLLREHAKQHGPVALIQFDAHTDTEEKTHLYDHGTMFFHAVNEGIVIPERSVQIGVRTEYDRRRHKFTVLDSAWITDRRPQEVVARIKGVVADQPVYVTFDVDCLDPAFAPGTGTPVVGGLSTDLALKIVRGLAGCNLIGMDIVEVCPPYDHADMTALAAATLGLELLYVLAANRKMKEGQKDAD